MLIIQKSQYCAVKKDLYFNNQTFFLERNIDGICILNEDLSSRYREADLIIPFHIVSAESYPNKVICIACDDTDVYISLFL